MHLVAKDDEAVNELAKKSAANQSSAKHLRTHFAAAKFTFPITVHVCFGVFCVYWHIFRFRGAFLLNVVDFLTMEIYFGSFLPVTKQCSSLLCKLTMDVGAETTNITKVIVHKQIRRVPRPCFTETYCLFRRGASFHYLNIL